MARANILVHTYTLSNIYTYLSSNIITIKMILMKIKFIDILYYSRLYYFLIYTPSILLIPLYFIYQLFNYSPQK
jgi:hypothetical protein